MYNQCMWEISNAAWMHCFDNYYPVEEMHYWSRQMTHYIRQCWS